jgi:hypothetical protein
LRWFVFFTGMRRSSAPLAKAYGKYWNPLQHGKGGSADVCDFALRLFHSERHRPVDSNLGTNALWKDGGYCFSIGDAWC